MQFAFPQEVRFTAGEVLEASKAVEAAAILLIVEGRSDTILMPPRRLSDASSGGQAAALAGAGEEFSFDGGAAIGVPNVE